MKQYLFVYGTLKNQYAPPEIAETVKKLKFLGDGFAYGKLYNLGDYPGAILGTEDKIFGNVFELPEDENVLSELDKYEGFHPQKPEESLYLRKKTKVYINNKILTSWIYEYNQDLSNKPRIKSGNYSNLQTA